jgi:hypothetical protein
LISFSHEACDDIGQQGNPLTTSLQSRITAELHGLKQAGFECEQLDIRDGKYGIFITLQSGSLVLLLPATYPQDPPAVGVFSEGDLVMYDFEMGAWTPQRTLKEVVKAFK